MFPTEIATPAAGGPRHPHGRAACVAQTGRFRSNQFNGERYRGSRFRTFADRTQGKDDPTARTNPPHYWDQQAWRDLQQFLPERLRLDEGNSPEEQLWDWRGSIVHLDR